MIPLCQAAMCGAAAMLRFSCTDLMDSRTGIGCRQTDRPTFHIRRPFLASYVTPKTWAEAWLKHFVLKDLGSSLFEEAVVCVGDV
jgi:hypothetical protein